MVTVPLLPPFPWIDRVIGGIVLCQPLTVTNTGVFTLGGIRFGIIAKGVQTPRISGGRWTVGRRFFGPPGGVGISGKQRSGISRQYNNAAIPIPSVIQMIGCLLQNHSSGGSLVGGFPIIGAKLK